MKIKSTCIISVSTWIIILFIFITGKICGEITESDLESILINNILHTGLYDIQIESDEIYIIKMPYATDNQVYYLNSKYFGSQKITLQNKIARLKRHKTEFICGKYLTVTYKKKGKAKHALKELKYSDFPYDTKLELLQTNLKDHMMTAYIQPFCEGEYKSEHLSFKFVINGMFVEALKETSSSFLANISAFSDMELYVTLIRTIYTPALNYSTVSNTLTASLCKKKPQISNYGIDAASSYIYIFIKTKCNFQEKQNFDIEAKCGHEKSKQIERNKADKIKKDTYRAECKKINKLISINITIKYSKPWTGQKTYTLYKKGIMPDYDVFSKKLRSIKIKKRDNNFVVKISFFAKFYTYNVLIKKHSGKTIKRKGFTHFSKSVGMVFNETLCHLCAKLSLEGKNKLKSKTNLICTTQKDSVELKFVSYNERIRNGKEGFLIRFESDCRSEDFIKIYLFLEDMNNDFGIFVKKDVEKISNKEVFYAIESEYREYYQNQGIQGKLGRCNINKMNDCQNTTIINFENSCMETRQIDYIHYSSTTYNFDIYFDDDTRTCSDPVKNKIIIHYNNKNIIKKFEDTSSPTYVKVKSKGSIILKKTLGSKTINISASIQTCNLFKLCIESDTMYKEVYEVNISSQLKFDAIWIIVAVFVCFLNFYMH